LSAIVQLKKRKNSNTSITPLKRPKHSAAEDDDDKENDNSDY